MGCECLELTKLWGMMRDCATQGTAAEEELESMRAEMHTLQLGLERARDQASSAAELQAQVLFSFPVLP